MHTVNVEYINIHLIVKFTDQDRRTADELALFIRNILTHHMLEKPGDHIEISMKNVKVRLAVTDRDCSEPVMETAHRMLERVPYYTSPNFA